MIYDLLPNKDENTYERFFRVIKQLCPATQPHSVLIDFETAATNAILTGFQTPGHDLSIEGCFFSFKSKHLQTHAKRRFEGPFQKRCSLCFIKLVTHWTALSLTPWR